MNARTIDVLLPNTNRYGGSEPGNVQLNPILPREKEGTITEFLYKRVAFGQKIEKLGRTSSVPIEYLGRSSLFFQGVHEAFRSHHALAIRPEVLHYMMLATVAQTVKNYPGTYKHLFTRSTSDEKTEIKVWHNGLVLGGNGPWHEVFPMFNTAFRKLVPNQELLATATKAYSLDTPEIQAATMVTFMDAASPFYSYGVGTLCGIPKIMLMGTADDYAALMQTALRLRTFFGEHLGDYFDRLAPILAYLSREYEAKTPDNEFWSSIYKYHSMSGSNRANGWLTYFLGHRNQPTKGLVARTPNEYEQGIELGEIPSHVSGVEFEWDYLGTKYPMNFLGGVLGLGITEHEGVQYLTPELSYAVTHRAEKK